jgi:hypothetical protein
VAAWVSDMFCNFYLVKSGKSTDNSTITEAAEKICPDLESLKLLKLLAARLTKLKND